jgi:VCBS repeat-containing protein
MLEPRVLLSAVQTNVGCETLEGAGVMIDSAHLLATDAEDGPEQLIFTLTDTVDHGTLGLDTDANGSIDQALGFGGTFTQADINAGRVVYFHDGSESTADSFIFDLTDSAGTGPANQVFAITVTAVNDAPVLGSLPAGGSVDVGSTYQYDVDATDADDASGLLFDVIANPVAAQDAAAVRWYRLHDASGRDALGQGHATVSGATAAVGPHGRTGTALPFDGVDDFVSIPPAADLGALAEGATFSAWIRLDALPDQGPPAVVFSNRLGPDGPPDAGEMDFNVDIDWTGRLHFSGSIGGASGVSFHIESTPGLVQADQWYHVSATLAHSGSDLTATLHLGDPALGTPTQVGAQTVAVGAGPITLVDQPLQVGRMGPFDSEACFTGRISDVALFDAALTASDLRRLMDASDAVIAADGTLSITPAPGSALGGQTLEVTVAVSDPAGARDSGAFTLTVVALNAAPVVSVPPAQALPEDQTLVFTGAQAIAISDADAGTGHLLVDLTVAHGLLTLASAAGLSFTLGDGQNDPALQFTGQLADLNAALDGLIYTPNLNFHGGDVLTVTVNDQGHSGSGGPLAHAQSIAITVTAVNDAPVLNHNTGMTVEEGATAVTIIAAMLQVTDIDNSAEQLVYTLTGVAAHGQLQLNGAPLGFGGIFTQADIDAGLLTYAHDGSETIADSFSFTVSDGAGGAIGATTFAITVTPVNDAPVLAHNTGLTVEEGATAVTITNAMLQVTDADNTAAELVFALTTVAAHGQLQLDGVALGLNNTFTQADIDAGLLTYSHDGSETIADSFTFTVSDGAGGSIGATSFAITVTPVNDAPVLAHNTGLTVEEGATAVTITSAMLQATDPDIATGPTVAGVEVWSSSWSSTFKDYLSSQGLGSVGYRIPTGSADQLRNLPWSNLDQITIVFSEDVVVAQDDLVITGVTNATYATSAFTYDPATFTATWTLSTAISNDKVRLSLFGDAVSGVRSATTGVALDGEFTESVDTYASSGDGTAGGDFRFRFDVLTGDVDDSGGVTSVDQLRVRVALFEDTTTPNYNPFYDIDGSGGITSVDQLQAQLAFGSSLANGSPSDPPVYDFGATTPAQLIYTLTAVATHGQLQLDGVALGVSDTFTQADIDAGRLTYTHDGSETTADGFTFTVADGAGGAIGATTFAITVTPVNDAPVLAHNTGLTVEEGATAVTITNAMLQVTDADNTAAELVFALTTVAAHGQLQLDGVALGVSAIFTQADIDAGLLTYSHDGSETIADSFTFTVADGAGSSIAATTFAITVTPVNDAPALNHNTGLALDEGATATISTAMLQVTDADNTAAELVFALTAVATHGQLQLDGVALGVSAIFTQADIDAGLLTYTHDGSETIADGFSFTVSDGAGSSIAATTFAITGTPVNDAPVLSVNAGLTMPEGWSSPEDGGEVGEWTATISSALLQATDADNAAAELIFTLTTVTAHGLLLLDGVVLGLNDIFTQADIDAGLLTYAHDFSETTADSFAFTISDGAGGSIAATSFAITITPVNDKPYLIRRRVTTFLEGGSTSVDNTMLWVLDGDATPDELVYTLVTTAQDAFLRLDGVDLVLGDTFTQADINAGRLTCVHNGSEPTPLDFFDVTVSDGVGGSTGTKQVFYSVTPVNDAPIITAPTSKYGGKNMDLVFWDITISDADAGSSPVQMTLSVDHGTLTLDRLAGLTGSGDGTGTLTYSGTLQSLGNALRGLIYRPATDYASLDTLTVTLNDQGNIGLGGPLADTASVDITILDLTVDLDVDSDNDNGWGLPELDVYEDSIEYDWALPGKIVYNGGDRVPVVISLAGAMDGPDALLDIYYSDVAWGGTMRLWTSQQAGTYIPCGEYSPATLGLSNSTPAIVLWIEGVTPSEWLEFIDLRFDDGSGYSLYDSVALTVDAVSVTPNAPVGLIAEATSATQIELRWTNVLPTWGRNGFRIKQSTNGVDFTEIGTTGSGSTSYMIDNLASGTTYYYQVSAYNSVGDSADAVSAPVTTLLETPTNITAVVISSTQLDLEWPPVSGATEYHIYHSNNGVDWNPTPDVSATSSFSITDLSDGQSHYYRVVAVNTSNTSIASNAVYIIAPPYAPINVAATGISSSQADISWADQSMYETGYVIQQSPNGIDGWTTVGTVGANVTNFTAPGPFALSTPYYFRVGAIGTGYPAPNANYAPGAIGSFVAGNYPQAPTNLTSSVVSDTEVALSWTASPDATGYRIEQQINGSGNWTLVDTTPNTTYTVTGLSGGTSYSFRVAATNSQGNSAYSNTTTKETPNLPPTIATAASVGTNPVTTTSTTLSALGADDGGESNLRYTWAVTNAPPGGSASFSANDSNAAKNTTVTFYKHGDYAFQVIITDARGLHIASNNVVVTVEQVATSLSISPTTTDVGFNGTCQFTATLKDQFNTAIDNPSFTWNATPANRGSISSSGLFTASTHTGTVTVTCSAMGTTVAPATATVNVSNRTTITFDDLAYGATVTNQYSGVTFAGTVHSDFSSRVLRPPGGWTGPLTVVFVNPVNDLQFDTGWVNTSHGGTFATIKLYSGATLVATVPVVADATIKHVNLNGYLSITRLEMSNTDPAGLGYDNFSWVVPCPDLDIDSDNNNRFSLPDRSEDEDELEEFEGIKVIVVNRNDDDDDQIPDYADGFDPFGEAIGEDDVTANEQFVPLVLQIPVWAMGGSVRFEYALSDPAAVSRTAHTVTGLDGEERTTYSYAPASEGFIRLWTASGSSSRMGTLVPVDTDILWSDLTTTDTVTLYVEAVTGSDEPVEISAILAIPETEITVTDTIRVLPLAHDVPLAQRYLTNADTITGFNVIPYVGGAPIEGTSGNDIIYGTPGNDIILGGGGDDIIIPGDGNDQIDAGAGNDYIFALGLGDNDTIETGSGEDVIEYDSEKAEGPQLLAQSLKAYRWLYQTDDPWLSVFFRIGGTIEIVEGDGVLFSTEDWDYVDGKPVVQVELEVAEPFKIAAAIRRQILSVAGQDREYKNAFTADIFQKAIANASTEFTDQAIDDYDTLCQLSLGSAAKASAQIAAIYLSGASIASEGTDFVMSLGDLINADNWTERVTACFGMLPLVPCVAGRTGRVLVSISELSYVEKLTNGLAKIADGLSGLRIKLTRAVFETVEDVVTAAGRHVPVFGKGHAAEMHAEAAEALARKLARNDAVGAEYVAVNLELRTIAGNLNLTDTRRPDVAIVRRDGRIDLYEVPSAGQDNPDGIRLLWEKLESMMNSLPQERRGVFDVLTPAQIELMP